MRAFEGQRGAASMQDDPLGSDEAILDEDGGADALRVDEALVDFHRQIVDGVSSEEDGKVVVGRRRSRAGNAAPSFVRAVWRGWG